MKYLLTLLLLFNVSICLGASRKVSDPNTNMNFSDIDAQLLHTVKDSSTQTIRGNKIFSDNTVFQSSVTANVLNVSSITLTNLTSLIKYKVGTFTSRSGTGTQSVTGVGFKPRAVLFFTGVGSGTSNSWGIGTVDNAGSQWCYGGSDTGGQNVLANTACMAVYTSAGAGYILFVYTSMDDDGFTINVTLSGGQLLIGYIAIQ